MLENIEIIMPINSKGEIDTELQNLIADDYKKIQKIKSLISDEIDKIIEMNIEYE
jgi:hypothetical protein